MEADTEMAGIEDTTTPYNVPLCAKYKQSFAYVSMKDRTPIILTKAIDHLARNKDDIVRQYGEESREELKVVIGRLSQLKNELQTDKPFTKLNYGSEADEWNKILEEKTQNGSGPTWFQTDWMYAECYFYRRINEAFLESKTLHTYDPFQYLKNETLESAMETMKTALAHYVLAVIEHESYHPAALENVLIRLLKHGLWANRVDLSLSAGSAIRIELDPLKQVNDWDEYIVVDNTEEVWFILKKIQTPLIDIVMDNIGFEALTDMCLADYLVTKYNASRVRFRIKKIPWFVSDVMQPDFDFAINRLAQNSDNASKRLAERWRSYLNNGTWTVHADQFWTMPYTYNLMEEKDPELYSQLKQSNFIVFKGDLNYRKLVGDIHWDPTYSFKKALQGFYPTTLVAVRTNKAETITGMLKSEVDEISRKDPAWLTSGQYGVIQHYSAI